jgi:hypothetical protein
MQQQIVNSNSVKKALESTDTEFENEVGEEEDQKEVEREAGNPNEDDYMEGMHMYICKYLCMYIGIYICDMCIYNIYV